MENGLLLETLGKLSVEVKNGFKSMVCSVDTKNRRVSVILDGHFLVLEAVEAPNLFGSERERFFARIFTRTKDEKTGFYVLELIEKTNGVDGEKVEELFRDFTRFFNFSFLDLLPLSLQESSKIIAEGEICGD